MRPTVPKLMGYNAAIHANNSMAKAFANLNNIASDYTDGVERKRSALANEAHNIKSLNETKRANVADEIHKKNKFGFEQKQYTDSQKALADKKEANASTIKTLYPKYVSSLGQTMGDYPSIENANKMNNILGSTDIGRINDKNKMDFDKSKFIETKRQNDINNGFKTQEIAFKKQNANKPKYSYHKLEDGSLVSINVSDPTKVSTIIKGAGEKVKPNYIIKEGANGTYIYLDKNNPKNIIDTKLKIPKKEKTVLDLLKEQKAKNELEDEKIAIKNSIANADKNIKQINDLIGIDKDDNIVNKEANDKLENSTGGFIGWNPLMSMIPNTVQKEVFSQIETIKSAAFTTSIDQLRGLGAMSEAEGEKITNAIANLDMGQNKEQVIRQLKYIRDTFSRARLNAMEKLKNRGVQKKNKWSEYDF